MCVWGGLQIGAETMVSFIIAHVADGEIRKPPPTLQRLPDATAVCIIGALNMNICGLGAGKLGPYRLILLHFFAIKTLLSDFKRRSILV